MISQWPLYHDSADNLDKQFEKVEHEVANELNGTSQHAFKNHSARQIEVHNNLVALDRRWWALQPAKWAEDRGAHHIYTARGREYPDTWARIKPTGQIKYSQYYWHTYNTIFL